MLCSYAARWCGVTEEFQYQFQSPVAGGCVMTSFSRQWSYSNWPVDSSMTTRLLLLFTNLATCRQSVDWICSAERSICNQTK